MTFIGHFIPHLSLHLVVRQAMKLHAPFPQFFHREPFLDTLKFDKVAPRLRFSAEKNGNMIYLNFTTHYLINIRVTFPVNEEERKKSIIINSRVGGD